MLRKFLQNTAETKRIYSSPVTASGSGSTLINDTKFNQTISSVAEIYRLIPDVDQGEGFDERTGNQIEPKRLTVQLALSLVTPSSAVTATGLGGNAISYPENITVHIFFLKSRQVADVANYTAIPITELMSEGGGQNAQQFDGSFWNAQLGVNSNLFSVIKHLKINMKKGNGWSSYVSYAEQSGSSVPPQLPCDGQADFNRVHRINVNIPMPKKLTYDSDFTKQPSNYFPFMVAGYTRNEYPVTTAWANTWYPLAISARTLFTYTDI